MENIILQICKQCHFSKSNLKSDYIIYNKKIKGCCLLVFTDINYLNCKGRCFTFLICLLKTDSLSDIDALYFALFFSSCLTACMACCNMHAVVWLASSFRFVCTLLFSFIVSVRT